MHLAQQEQDITGKMSKRAIALFIFAPTAIDLPSVERQSLGVPCSFGVVREQRIPKLVVAGNLLLEFVKLSAGACLSAVKTARIEEQWSAHLLRVFIDGSCRESLMHPPVCSKHSLDALPGRQLPFLHLDD